MYPYQQIIPESLGVLRKYLKNETGIMVRPIRGRQVVVNQPVWLPDAEISIGAVSKATSEGVHTTTASAMHRLPNGGRLIDSPGVREFVPVAGDALEIQRGYPEISLAAQECRFSNCRHLRETRLCRKTGSGRRQDQSKALRKL